MEPCGKSLKRFFFSGGEDKGIQAMGKEAMGKKASSQ